MTPLLETVADTTWRLRRAERMIPICSLVSTGELSIPGAETGIVLFTPEGHEDRIGTFVNTSWEVDNIDRKYDELLGLGVEFAGLPEPECQGKQSDSENARIGFDP